MKLGIAFFILEDCMKSIYVDLVELLKKDQINRNQIHSDQSITSTNLDSFDIPSVQKFVCSITYLSILQQNYGCHTIWFSYGTLLKFLNRI